MQQNGKSFWKSKTFWVNVLGLAGIVAQGQFGFVLSAETQVSILAGINMFLRLVTKEAVVWPGVNKNISHMLLACGVVGILAGCGIYDSQPSVCASINAGDSYLCDIAADTGVQLEDVGNTLIVANAIAISSGAYTADQALLVLTEIRDGLANPVSYRFVQRAIKHAVTDHPGLFIVATAYLDRLSKPQIILPADVDILRSWLARQITLLQALSD